jgi:hypothetical protein
MSEPGTAEPFTEQKKRTVRENSANLFDPEMITVEIADDLQAALDRFSQNCL